MKRSNHKKEYNNQITLNVSAITALESLFNGRGGWKENVESATTDWISWNQGTPAFKN